MWWGQEDQVCCFDATVENIEKEAFCQSWSYQVSQNNKKTDIASLFQIIWKENTVYIPFFFPYLIQKQKRKKW